MFPWQSRKTVELLSVKVDTGSLPWCREARVLWVRGSGVLRWEDCGSGGSWNSLLRLTLRGRPLLYRDVPECPTCAGLLATGWGMEENCPELWAVGGMLNGEFPGLETAAEALTPLLGLLESGLYVLTDMDCFPADGEGRFFWDAPDALTVNAATAPLYFSDEDFDYVYAQLPPVFLYPSQQRERFCPERAAAYRERFLTRGGLPRGLAFLVAEGVSLLLDGHHKACAAAELGMPLPCLTVLPLEGYTWKKSPFLGKLMWDRACFGPFSIPVEALPVEALPEKPWERVAASGVWQESDGLGKETWPEALQRAGERYPTARGFAAAVAAELGREWETNWQLWLEKPLCHGAKLRGVLALLGQSDPRRKEIALACARRTERRSLLCKEAFGALALMKGDEQAEAFFVDYFVELDEAYFPAELTEIAHSFWN